MFCRNNYLISNLYEELKSVLYFSPVSCCFSVVVECLCSPLSWCCRWGCYRGRWCTDRRTRSHCRPRWCPWAGSEVTGWEDPPASPALRPGWNTPWGPSLNTPDFIRIFQISKIPLNCIAGVFMVYLYGVFIAFIASVVYIFMMFVFEASLRFM